MVLFISLKLFLSPLNVVFYLGRGVTTSKKGSKLPLFNVKGKTKTVAVKPIHDDDNGVDVHHESTNDECIEKKGVLTFDYILFYVCFITVLVIQLILLLLVL